MKKIINVKYISQRDTNSSSFATCAAMMIQFIKDKEEEEHVTGKNIK